MDPENNDYLSPSTSKEQPGSSQISQEDVESAIASLGISKELASSMTSIAENAPKLLIKTYESGCIHNEFNTKLSLAYGGLYEIPISIVEQFSVKVKYLDISHNKITNLDALVFFKNLSSLIADNNPITEDCLLPPLPNLQLLWLNHCQITSLYPWVGKLKESCPGLKYLCLMGNPAAPSLLNGGTFYDYLQYRLFVISQFPSLTHLDDRKITEDQRIEAQRLYKRPFVEKIVKPSSSGFSSIVHMSVNWNSISTLGGLWKGKDDGQNLDRVRADRNLLI